jgi:hypothetical protein
MIMQADDVATPIVSFGKLTSLKNMQRLASFGGAIGWNGLD